MAHYNLIASLLTILFVVTAPFLPVSSLDLTVSRKYIWKDNLEVHYSYTTATTVAATATSSHRDGHGGPSTAPATVPREAVLLIPGFGVGTFHYERNRQALCDQNYDVFSIDLLGQGDSWPTYTTPVDASTEYANDHDRDRGQLETSPSSDLRYSLDTWADEIVYFLDHILPEHRGSTGKTPVHLVGNSLGGFLSVMIAARRPDLVKSIALLNATPIWGFNSDSNAHFLWTGSVGSMPKWALNFGRQYFDTLRNPRTIRQMLSVLYQSAEAIDDKLITGIVEAASHPIGPVAFTSIAFSPKSALSFDEMLTAIDDKHCPICLIYGKQDPWITPFWGQRIKRMKPRSLYFELSPVGHCPHHEAADPVNVILGRWWSALTNASADDDDATAVASLMDDCAELQGSYPNRHSGRQVAIELVDGSPRTLAERLLQFIP